MNVAVITGGHSYDVPNFHRLFGSIAGAEVIVQHLDDFCSSAEKVRQGYDVVVFYIMMMETPRDDGPWYNGRQRTALEQLGATRQGILVLHHALLAYPDWPV